MNDNRTWRDDLKWALAVLVGFAIGALVFGAEAAVFIGAAVGVTLVVAVRILLRHRRQAARRT
jgi:hypothetical protein